MMSFIFSISNFDYITVEMVISGKIWTSSCNTFLEHLLSAQLDPLVHGEVAVTHGVVLLQQGLVLGLKYRQCQVGMCM